MTDRIRVFVSSPADVALERRRAERVANRLTGAIDGVEIEIYRWEEGQYFSAHDGFQEQIPDVAGFDIVIALFWSRLGSPLPPEFPQMPDGRPYPSGSAYEVLRAIEHRRTVGTGPPDIFVYRKMAPPPMPVDSRTLRDAAKAALDTLDDFFAEWFVNKREGFKAAFTPFETPDDFAAMFERHMRAWLLQNRRFGRERAWRIEDPKQGSPFPGLDAFGANRRAVFFGRLADTERARERLEDAAAAGCGFLLIEGASGTGKSSLARAGLLPRMGELDLDLRVAVVDEPGKMPLLALSEALFAPGAVGTELAGGDFPTVDDLYQHFDRGGGMQPVVRALARAGAQRSQAEGHREQTPPHLVVLFDQAEGLFSDSVLAADRKTVTKALHDLASSDGIRVVATLRADARAAALEELAFAQLIDTGAGLSLSMPGPDALADVVRRPAQAAGLAFERRAEDGLSLDELLLEECRDAAALPLLQFALAELTTRAVDRAKQAAAAAGRRFGDLADDAPLAVLTFADYDALGGLSGVIDRCAEVALEALPAASRDELPRLVRTLTNTGLHRSYVLRPALLSEVASDAEGAALVTALVQARILTLSHERVRFTHEAALTSWTRAAEAVRSAERFLRIRTGIAQMADRWREGGRNRSLLIPSGVPLAEALEVLRDYGQEIPEANRRFIKRSRSRARVAQTALAALAACATAIAIAAVVFFLDAAEQEARAVANASQARLSAAEAQANAKDARTNAAEAEAQRARAEASAQTAATEAARAREAEAAVRRALASSTKTVNDILDQLVADFVKLEVPTESMIGILARTTGLLEQLRAEAPNDPDLRLASARTLVQLFDLYIDAGEGELAIDSLAQAERLTEGLRVAAEDLAAMQLELLPRRAGILYGDGEFAASEAMYLAAIERAEQVTEWPFGDPNRLVFLSRQWQQIFYLRLRGANDLPGAQAAADAHARIVDRPTITTIEGFERDLLEVRSKDFQLSLAIDTRDLQRAKTVLHDIIALMEEMHEARPDDTRVLRSLAYYSLYLHNVERDIDPQINEVSALNDCLHYAYKLVEVQPGNLIGVNQLLECANVSVDLGVPLPLPVEQYVFARAENLKLTQTDVYDLEKDAEQVRALGAEAVRLFILAGRSEDQREGRCENMVSPAGACTLYQAAQNPIEGVPSLAGEVAYWRAMTILSSNAYDAGPLKDALPQVVAAFERLMWLDRRRGSDRSPSRLFPSIDRLFRRLAHTDDDDYLLQFQRAGFHQAAAEALVASGELDGARERWQHAIEIRRVHVETYDTENAKYNLAVTLWEARAAFDATIAQRLFDEAIDIVVRPDVKDTLSRETLKYFAREVAKQAGLDLNALEDRIRIANDAFDVGQHQQAFETMLAAISDWRSAPRLSEVLPARTASLMGSLSFVALFADDFSTAEEMARDALALDPSATWINGNLALSLMYLGKTEEARDLFLGFVDQKVSTRRSWKDAVRSDFADLKAAGRIHPLMREIEAEFDRR